MRLIDADRLINEFHRETVEREGSNLWHISGIMAFIENEPTAFDVEEVVKEVQDIGTRFCTTVHCNNECENCDHGSIMKAVIDAVRKGGVKND
jgi:hypothetical protein